jgi:hypothetical protein
MTFPTVNTGDSSWHLHQDNVEYDLRPIWPLGTPTPEAYVVYPSPAHKPFVMMAMRINDETAYERGVHQDLGWSESLHAFLAAVFWIQRVILPGIEPRPVVCSPDSVLIGIDPECDLAYSPGIRSEFVFDLHRAARQFLQPARFEPTTVLPAGSNPQSSDLSARREN